MFQKTALSFFRNHSLITHVVVASLFGATLVGCRCTDTRTPEAKNDKQSEQKIAEAEASKPSSEPVHISEEDASSNRGEQIALVDEVKARPITEAFSKIQSLQDSKVKGTVTFTKVSGGVRIVADVEGLAPGEHGFHIHEHGSCEGDGTSAGGHYNPTNTKHGGPDDLERHVGDFGNLLADDEGKAHYERIDSVISLEGEQSIIGKSLVIHADRDDFVTQPTGNSGKRVACGLIEARQR